MCDDQVLVKAAEELEERGQKLLDAAATLRKVATHPLERSATKPRRAAAPAAVKSLRHGGAVDKKSDQAVLEVIAKRGAQTASEIGDALKVNVSTAYSRLQRMVRDGVLVCGGNKKYARPVGQPAGVQ